MIFRARLMACAVLLLAAVSGSVALAQTGGPILVMADGPNGVEKINKETAHIDGTEWTEAPIVESGLTMHVLFKDPDNAGFRDATLGKARRARLYDALDYVAKTLKAPGELNVMIGLSESDGTGPLAQGGPMFTSADGIVNGTVFQRLHTGTAPFPGYAEMTLTFDWGYSWHLGTDAPPEDSLDLWSVAVHEATHCLGFISLMSSDGSSRFMPGTNTYTVFDSLLATKSPLKRLLGGTAEEPVFVGVQADLTGGGLVFDGTATIAALGSPPSIYSSSPFLQGTSLQHWTEDAIPGGGVMEPRYSYGVARRQYTGIDIGVLRDIGWTEAEAPEHEPCPLQSVTLDQPSKSAIAADASGNALVQFRATVVVNTTLDPLCGAADGVLQVEYFVDDVSRGTSGDQAGGFPLNVTLGLGAHTARASATRTDTTEDPVVAEKTFSILTVVPCPIQSVALVQPSQSAITAGASGTAPVQLCAKVVLDNSDPLCVGGDGVLHVEYFVDNVSSGTSGDQADNFPLNVTLGVGTHTVRASATRTDSTADPVEAKKTLSITAAVISPTPIFAVSPVETSRAFGDLNTGASTDAAYTVTNAGTGTLNGSASLSGDAEFQFVGASTYSLTAGVGTTITVRFTADKKGDFTGTLSFSGNGGNATVALTGTGVKTGGTFNCSGGREAPVTGVSDLLVGLLAASALLLARGRPARQ